MKLLNLFISILFISTTSVVMADQSEDDKLLAAQKESIIDRTVLMIGMGLSQRIAGDYYIGALYLDENVQYDGGRDFLFVDVPRRMEFRIASDSSISARSFGRKIAEGIRINNKREDVTNQKVRLGRLMKMFRGTYSKGDAIQFDFHASFGVRVKLNDRILGEINNRINDEGTLNEFYNLLVRVWVGDRPPSSVFKQGIIGKNEPNYAVELLRKYVAL